MHLLLYHQLCNLIKKAIKFIWQDLFPEALASSSLPWCLQIPFPWESVLPPGGQGEVGFVRAVHLLHFHPKSPL